MDFFGFISKISFSSESFASLVFFVMAALTAIVSVIFFFHWRKYGMGGIILAITELVYLGVAATLLGVAFFGIN